MTRFRRLACGLAIVCLCALLRAQTIDGYGLFQQALTQERAVGDLTAAIDLYRRIADDRSVDRALAARALMRMAGCYDQLGSPEARKIYERVVSGFSDQPAAVAEARRRLQPATNTAIRPEPPPGLLARPSTPVPLANIPAGVLSPNARFGAAIAGNNLVLNETGATPRPLATASNGARPCGQPAWSRDSTSVLYAWCLPGGTTEVRAADVTKPAPRTLARIADAEITPLDWSIDKQSILVRLDSIADDVTRLGLVNASTGTVRTLKTGPRSALWPLAGAVQFSADSRVVVYTPDDDAHGIVVMSIADGVERPLLSENSREVFLGWTAAGRLLYSSHRRGVFDIWIADFADGRIEGLPTRVASDVSDIVPVRLADSGDLYYTTYAPPNMRPGGGSDLYLAPVDGSGRISGPVRPASHSSVGHMSHPVWSHDGRQLAYKVGTDPIHASIVIQTLATGRERTIDIALDEIGQFDWSRDGQSLLVAGVRDLRQQIVRLDLNNGRASVMVESPLDTASRSPGAGALTQPRWLGDGGAFLFASNAKVERFDPGPGTRRLILTAPANVQSLALSPDSSSIAFITAGRLMVASLEDGKSRNLTPINEGASAKSVTWSADGRFVIYCDRTAAMLVPDTTQAYSELWRIPAAGGEPERMGLAADGLHQPAMSPDGLHLAISVALDIRTGTHLLRAFLPR